VKLSTLLEIIGSGSILLVVGVGMLLLGIGYGFSEATHLPLWASFGGLGILTAIVGVALIDRGSVEAEVQVAKKMPFIMNVIHSPWWTLGASVVGGIFLQRLLRGRRDIVVENIMPTAARAAAVPAVEPTEYTQHVEATPKEEGFSISQYVSDQLRTLGTEAGSAAIALGMQALGVPSIKQLIADLMSGKEHSDDKPPTTTTAAQNDPMYESASLERDWGNTSRGPVQASHNGNGNGSRSPGEFDLT